MSVAEMVRAGMMRRPWPGDRVGFVDGSSASVLRVSSDSIVVRVAAAGEFTFGETWPLCRWQLEVLGAVEMWPALALLHRGSWRRTP